VGIGLITEVLAWAPGALGPSERMVLIVIAEDARDATRESWAMKPEQLGARAGLKPAALQKVFQRLAKVGLEVRVPLKIGKDGRPVYAYEGKRSTYRLPHLQRVDSVPSSEERTDSALSDQDTESDAGSSDTEGGNDSTLSSQEGGTESSQGGTQSALFGSEGGTGSSEGGTGSTPTPHYPSSTSSPSEKKGGAGGNTRRASKAPDAEHPRFAEWYAAYPKKEDPGRARRAFNNALPKVGGDPKILIDAAKRYAAAKAKTEKRYIKQPATWLNAEAWLNEEDLAATGTDGIAGHGALADTAAVDWSKGIKL